MWSLQKPEFIRTQLLHSYYVDVIKAMKAPQRRVKWIQKPLLLLKLCDIKLI